jgi:hypothetical protein
MVTTLFVSLFFVPVLYRLLAAKKLSTGDDFEIDFEGPPVKAHDHKEPS